MLPPDQVRFIVCYGQASPDGDESPFHAGFFTRTFDHVCSTTETMISAMPRTNEKFNSWYSWKINIARMML